MSEPNLLNQVPGLSDSRVSVIVPTLNNERTLRLCLRALNGQSRQPDEIIVVDGGSTDATCSIAQEDARLLNSKVANRCYQQNLAAEFADGDYLLFLDADMTLSELVIEQALSAAANCPRVALTIPEVSTGKTFWARAKAFERSFYAGVWWIEAARWFPREVFTAVCGFDPAMVGVEDWDIDQRVRALTEVSRISAPAYHDEGDLRVMHLAARKAHYSATFDKFRERHPARANLAMGIGPRVRLFASQPLEIMKHPVLSFGVAALGLAEIASTRGWLKTTDPWPEERPIVARVAVDDRLSDEA